MIEQSASLNKQQCNVSGLIFSWAGYLAVLIYFAAEQDWRGATVWLVAIPVVRWVLFHYFPSVSRFLGYGRVDDTHPDELPASPSRVVVKFYSFFSCPFCPIVLHRLESLQTRMNFTIERIDVSLKPQILMSKGIRSVPVVEVGTDRLVGNATTEQLAGFIGLAHGAA